MMKMARDDSSGVVLANAVDTDRTTKVEEVNTREVVDLQ